MKLSAGSPLEGHKWGSERQLFALVPAGDQAPGPPWGCGVGRGRRGVAGPISEGSKIPIPADLVFPILVRSWTLGFLLLAPWWPSIPNPARGWGSLICGRVGAGSGHPCWLGAVPPWLLSSSFDASARVIKAIPSSQHPQDQSLVPRPGTCFFFFFLGSTMC